MVKLSRDTYKSIKKYTKEEMEQFLLKYYIHGYNEGCNVVLDIVAPSLEEALASTRGIGQKRAETIMIKFGEILENKRRYQEGS